MNSNTTGTISGDLTKARGKRRSPFKGIVDDLMMGAIVIFAGAIALALLGGMVYAIGRVLPTAPWAPSVIDLRLIRDPFGNGLVWVIDALCLTIPVLLIGRIYNGKSI